LPRAAHYKIREILEKSNYSLWNALPNPEFNDRLSSTWSDKSAGLINRPNSLYPIGISAAHHRPACVRENGVFNPQDRSDIAFPSSLTEACLPVFLPIRAPQIPGAFRPLASGWAGRREIGTKPRHLIAPYPGGIIRHGIDNIHRFVISRANFSVWYA